MSGFAAMLSRIAQLDGLVRRVDPSWSGSPYLGQQSSIGSAPAGAGQGEFASILQAVSAPPPGGVAGGGASPVRYASSVEAAPQGGVTGAASSFRSPLPSGRLTLGFGPTSLEVVPGATIGGVRYAHFHQGMDLAAPQGTPVGAAAAGTVVAAGRASDGAVIVRIRHADGSETLYGHLQPKLLVTAGQQVEAGQQLGTVGMTGNTTGPHLHFALYKSDKTPIDPAAWLAAGHLPGVTASGAATGTQPVAGAPVAGAAGDWHATADALARFDRIASEIPYASLIRRAAVENDVDPLLLTALVRAESGFHPDAVSRVGAMGLTQLMPATARSLGVKDPFDAAQNLEGGAHYLAGQLKRFGRVDLALAAYQAGPTLVARLGKVPEYKSTQAYVRHITGWWADYRSGKA